MKLYSRRMQIEQNFRDEKSERFGFGLRASYSRSAGRMLVMSLLATLRTIVLWLRHCCKVSDEAAFCLIQRPYISKTLLTRRISPRGSP